MARDTFIIYYFQDGRWSVHATFEANERDVALLEAQKVEKTINVPVRLVRDTFDPDTNTSDEAVSWQSAKAKQMGDADSMFGEAGKGAAPAPKAKPKSAPAQPRRIEKPKAKTEEPAAKPKPVKKPPPKRKAKSRGGRGMTTKLAIVVSMSLLNSAILVSVAALAVYVATDKLHVLEYEDRSPIFAGLFVVSYALSAIYYLGKQFDIQYGFGKKRKVTESAGAVDMIKRMQTSAPRLAPEGEGFTQADVEELREAIEQDDAEAEGDRTGADDFITDVQTATEEPAPVEAAPAPAEPQPQAAPEPPKAEPAKPEPPKPKPVEQKQPDVSPGEAEARQGFLAFVGETMNAAQRQNLEMNAFSRFGMNLYLAGACAAVGQSRKVGRAPQLAILRDGLQAAGNSRERAESFCAELPTFGKNPRYAGMIQAGGSAMSRQMAGQPANGNELSGLLNEWTKPEKRTAVPTAFTFMFTDIVNSTALTSQLGNAGAQRVVRTHNTAVRGAIQAVGGREVKHTGDGIMATFPSAAAAVQAGIRAQREIASQNAANPSIAFNIRIGINVGEAVEEDNDFFGAAVQMTARICAACTPANVWVSRAVIDACKGERLGFIPRGAFQMKGIQQARPLYEVAYTDAHRNELSNL